MRPRTGAAPFSSAATTARPKPARSAATAMRRPSGTPSTTVSPATGSRVTVGGTTTSTLCALVMGAARSVVMATAPPQRRGRPRGWTRERPPRARRTTMPRRGSTPAAAPRRPRTRRRRHRTSRDAGSHRRGRGGQTHRCSSPVRRDCRTMVSSCSWSTPAVPLTSAQFRRASAAQVRKISAFAAGEGHLDARRVLHGERAGGGASPARR